MIIFDNFQKKLLLNILYYIHQETFLFILFIFFISFILFLFFKKVFLQKEIKPDLVFKSKFSELENKAKKLSPKYIELNEILLVFPQNVSDINRMLENVLNDSKKVLDSWLISEEKNLLMLLKFDSILTTLSGAEGSFCAMSYVLENKEIMNYAIEARTKILDFLNTYVFCTKVYQHFQHIVDSLDKELLKEDELLFIKKILSTFVAAGCNLTNEKYSYFKKIVEKEDVLVSEFLKNIALFSKKLHFTKQDLFGVSDRFLDSLEKTEDGKFIVGVDYPSYFEVIENCVVSQTRQEIYKLFMNRSYPENGEVLTKIIDLRRNMAELLSFPDYATFNISNKMAGSPEAVLNFLNLIKDSIKDAATNQFAKLVESLPEGVELNENNCLAPWDYLFVRSQYEKKHFKIDVNLISEYFPLGSTLTNIFSIYENLLGLKFDIQKNSYDNFWHKDVIFIKVLDSKTSELVGHLFLDLHPRENKYTHACCCGVVLGVENEIISQKPVSLVIANFPKSINGEPALLKYNDVRTFFHELGHGMHCMLGQTKFGSFSGYNVLDDFCETPSQMFEEWMCDSQVLQKISSHYQTGKSLSEDLIEVLLNKEEAFVALNTQRQVKLSLFSLYVHSAFPTYDSFKDLERMISLEVPDSVFSINDAHFYASFGHVVSGGYAASYYLYLWSLVYSKDLWSQVEALGIESEATAKLVRDLLAKGGSVHPMKLMRNVLGREVSHEAFMKYLSKR